MGALLFQVVVRSRTKYATVPISYINIALKAESSSEFCKYRFSPVGLPKRQTRQHPLKSLIYFVPNGMVQKGPVGSHKIGQIRFLLVRFHAVSDHLGQLKLLFKHCDHQ